MKYVLRKAFSIDLEDVMSLIKKRIRWMDEQGIRQWNVTDYLETYPITYYQEQQKSGNLYVLCNSAEKIIGAVVLFDEDNRWADSENVSALYIHNLVTTPDVSGAGEFIIKEVERIAVDSKKKKVRLDCAADNWFLNRYYETRGYKQVGHFKEGSYVGNRREKNI